jgi:hypothetical protein
MFPLKPTVFSFTVFVATLSVAADPKLKEHSIHIDQPLAEAKQAFADCGFEISEGGFSFAAREDAGHLSGYLDKEHAMVCIGYSQRTQKVTSISLVFFPGPMRRGKVYDSWVPATGLTLRSDGSYSARFPSGR